MRRDLHRWFLFGIACTTTLSLLVYMLMQNFELAIGTLVTCYVALVASLIHAWRRRKLWRQMFPHDDPLRSREMRCKMAKLIGRA